ncbi:hypothetical protein SDC9_95791 [bioreactor metagenome]|uniref:Uncharacterized protein n=1 Tax=bioreactor metagenome TaxID=1076179 RepID=A0A645AE04_9ZZZZ
MKTMDMAISELYRNGEISKDVAMTYAVDKEILSRMMLM